MTLHRLSPVLAASTFRQVVPSKTYPKLPVAPTRLLSVREAADRLGVHVTTVRRWTDDGRLASVRTEGGHRRIPLDAVERLRAPEPRSGGLTVEPARTVSTVPAAGSAADEAWAEHAAVHTRYEIRSNPTATWNQALTADDREERRETGRQLMGLLLRHVADRGDADARGAEIRRLAWGYAVTMQDRGLSLTEALKATLFFRDVISESTAFHPRFEESPVPDQIGLMRRVNEFMNEVQLTIAQAYEADRA